MSDLWSYSYDVSASSAFKRIALMVLPVLAVSISKAPTYFSENEGWFLFPDNINLRQRDHLGYIQKHKDRFGDF